MKFSGAKYRISFGNDNPDSILIRDTRVWGTAVEILAIASALHIPVFILIPDVNTYNWFCYNPLHEDRLTIPSKDPPTKQLSRLNDINVRGCHYDLDCILLLDEPPLNQSVRHYCVSLSVHIFFFYSWCYIDLFVHYH